MKTRYSWIDLPEITILTAPFAGGLARHGAITIGERHYINFLLLPHRQFLVFYAASDVPDGAVLVLCRLIFDHQCGTGLYSSPPGEIPMVKSWPPTKNQGRDRKQVARCWEIGTGDASASLDILDDKEWATAKVQFGPCPTEPLLRQVAATVLWHWADLQAAGEAMP